MIDGVAIAFLSLGAVALIVAICLAVFHYPTVALAYFALIVIGLMVIRYDRKKYGPM